MCKEETVAETVQNGDMAKKTVSQLVSEHPLRATIFEEYHIDFCCGGNVNLEEICRIKNLPLAEIMQRLSVSDRNVCNENDWTKASLQSLVFHIIKAYHEPLREQLAYVSKLAEKVARVHGEKHPEMRAVERLFGIFREELEMHMQKEEMVLFPAIVSLESGEAASTFGCGPGLQMPVMVMVQEHEQAGRMLDEFSRLTNAYRPPEDACHSFKVLLFLLHTIETDLHMHVHKENNILFPRALALKKSVALSTVGDDGSCG